MYVALHNWPLFAVETAVLVVGLLHIYLELRKKQKPQMVQIKIWRIDLDNDVKEKKNDKK